MDKPDLFVDMIGMTLYFWFFINLVGLAFISPGSFYTLLGFGLGGLVFGVIALVVYLFISRLAKMKKRT